MKLIANNHKYKIIADFDEQPSGQLLGILPKVMVTSCWERNRKLQPVATITINNPSV
jgi:hypothetical protein